MQEEFDRLDLREETSAATVAPHTGLDREVVVQLTLELIEVGSCWIARSRESLKCESEGRLSALLKVDGVETDATRADERNTGNGLFRGVTGDHLGQGSNSRLYFGG